MLVARGKDSSLISCFACFCIRIGSYTVIIQRSENFKIFKIVDNSKACIFGNKTDKNDFRCSLQAGWFAPCTHLSSVSAWQAVHTLLSPKELKNVEYLKSCIIKMFITSKMREIKTISGARCKRERYLFDIVFCVILYKNRFIHCDHPKKWKF